MVEIVWCELCGEFAEALEFAAVLAADDDVDARACDLGEFCDGCGCVGVEGRECADGDREFLGAGERCSGEVREFDDCAGLV